MYCKHYIFQMALNRKKRKHSLGKCVGANLQVWITFLDRVVKASSLNSNLIKAEKQPLAISTRKFQAAGGASANVPRQEQTWCLKNTPFPDVEDVWCGEGNGTPLQYSCLENPMDGEAWWAAVHGVAKSQTRLNDFTFNFHFPLACIGEGNGNPLQYSCLDNPRDGGAWWATVYGVTQSQTRLKRLSSSSKMSGIGGCWVLHIKIRRWRR